MATWLKVRTLLLDWCKRKVLLKKGALIYVCKHVNVEVTKLLGNHFLARYRQLSRCRFQFSNKWRRFLSVVRDSDC